MKVLQQIHNAKESIKKSDLKKQGKNTHSNYDYYTPEQVEQLVFDACKIQKLFNKYDLKRTEYGLMASIEVVDLDSGEKETFVQATDIPSITATNVAQQIGGAITYSERYLLQTIYGIKDNNSDFDSDSYAKKTPQKETIAAVKKELTQSEVDDKWNGSLYKGNIVYIDNIKYVVSQEQADKLKTHSKFKPSKNQ